MGITTPAEGSSFDEGELVTFAGTATDPEDGDLSAGLSWTSDLGGEIGTGGSFTTTTLSVGTHTVTASVTDAGGLTGSDAISVIITVNTAPTVAITDPSDGAIFEAGQAINFTAVADDAEESDLSASIVWSSDLDGPIGTGASLSMSTLSVGTHAITATVTDAGGLTNSDQRTMRVVSLVFTPSTEDATADKRNPTDFLGSLETLKARTQQKQGFIAYLKFAVGGLAETVQSATLRLYVLNGTNATVSVHSAENMLSDMSTPWTNANLNWQNRPGFSTTPLSSLGPLANETWVEFDVTAAFSEAKLEYSFALTNGSANTASFNSSEAPENQPLMLIDLQP